MDKIQFGKYGIVFFCSFGVPRKHSGIAKLWSGYLCRESRRIVEVMIFYVGYLFGGESTISNKACERMINSLAATQVPFRKNRAERLICGSRINQILICGDLRKGMFAY
jgi:hypothetical protein